MTGARSSLRAHGVGLHGAAAHSDPNAPDHPTRLVKSSGGAFLSRVAGVPQAAAQAGVCQTSRRMIAVPGKAPGPPAQLRQA